MGYTVSPWRWRNGCVRHHLNKKKKLTTITTVSVAGELFDMLQSAEEHHRCHWGYMLEKMNPCDNHCQLQFRDFCIFLKEKRKLAQWKKKVMHYCLWTYSTNKRISSWTVESPVKSWTINRSGDRAVCSSVMRSFKRKKKLEVRPLVVMVHYCSHSPWQSPLICRNRWRVACIDGLSFSSRCINGSLAFDDGDTNTFRQSDFARRWSIIFCRRSTRFPVASCVLLFRTYLMLTELSCWIYLINDG